ncbi:MAG: hypothetical protein ABR507_06235 [Actinomycetota bacterium]|nr:hypothetical protein [Actinomycetota bacterium]
MEQDTQDLSEAPKAAATPKEASRIRSLRPWQIGGGVALVALAGLGVAYSQHAFSTDPSKQNTKSPGSAATGPASGSTSGPGTGQVDPSAPVIAGGESNKGGFTLPDHSPVPQDFAAAVYPRKSKTDPTPAQCPIVHGRHCSITFKGNYKVTNYDSAVVWVGAYEDGQPTAQALSMVVPKGGPKAWYATLNYIPSPTAKQVQFRVQLKDLKGNIIFDFNKNDPPITIK